MIRHTFHFAAQKSRKKFPSSTTALRYKSSQQPNNAGILDSATDYLSTLRRRAADALTSSLSKEERNQLLQKFEPEATSTRTAAAAQEDDSHVPAHSIAEAVAAARAQDAKLHQEKWEREKQQLVLDAEEAARARVGSDLAIQRRQLAFEAWKQKLEEENKQQESAAAVVISKETQQEQLGTHPILGPALVDLGHKRVHLVSAKALATIPVWKKQRIYRHERAKNMASDKLKSLDLGLPGIIGIYESKDGTLSILDGQHRVGMMQVLQEKAKSSEFDFDRILVEVFPQREEKDTDHAQDIFLEVNKAEPVKLVDLPGIAKKSHRTTINEAAARLHETYPEMFSSSQRCRAPHLNIDNLRDALFASNVIDRHSLKSPKALEAWMTGQNESLATKYQQQDAKKTVSKTALEKSIQYDFYLGLDSSWLYN